MHITRENLIHVYYESVIILIVVLMYFVLILAFILMTFIFCLSYLLAGGFKQMDGLKTLKEMIMEYYELLFFK